MKPSTGSRSVKVVKKTANAAKAAKAAVLNKPRKYKNIGGVGSSTSSPRSTSSPKSTRSPKSASSPRSPSSTRSPKSGSNPKSARSPIISISKEDKKELKDISYDIVELITIYKALSEVSVKNYSFNELGTSKTDFLVETRVKTKLIKEVINKIFVKVKKSQFISIDTHSYEIFSYKYDVQINNIIDRITRMTTNEFIVEATYTRFFVDLHYVLLIFFDLIQKNIKINGDISDIEIINIVDNEILRCAKGGYTWFSDTKNKEIGNKNIKLFIEIQGKIIRKQEQDRANKEFIEFIERERRYQDIEAFYNLGKNKKRGW